MLKYVNNLLNITNAELKKNVMPRSIEEPKGNSSFFEFYCLDIVKYQAFIWFMKR